jgi:hypothetical protein
MRKIIARLSIVSLIAIVLSTHAIGQKTDTGPKFDIQDFNKKFETVQWLVEYDAVAWKTSDVVVTEDKSELAKLGNEWFCFQDKDKTWHAVYGKLGPTGFVAVFHYVYGKDGKITKTAEKPDQVVFDRYANALATARSKLLGSIPVNSPIFNQYIRRKSDDTFDVWMLPAFQRDGTAVYGGEAYYSLDSAGTKILKEESYFQKAFRGFQADPAREITVDYHELGKPTLGGIFFVWYYKSYFTKIYLVTAKSTSTVVDTGKDGYIWVHADKSGQK